MLDYDGILNHVAASKSPYNTTRVGENIHQTSFTHDITKTSILVLDKDCHAIYSCETDEQALAMLAHEYDRIRKRMEAKI